MKKYLNHVLTVLGLIYKDGEKGAMNIGGIMMLGIAMVFIAIGFIFLPISTSATSDILAWTYSANASISDAIFTGYSAVVGITPLLILVGFLAAAVVSGMMGVKAIKGGASTSTNPGSLMLLGLSIIFISIGLIIEPVLLEAITSVLDDFVGYGGATTLATYSGYVPLLLVSPMLVHIGFLAAAVLSGFFGLKKLGAGAD